MNGYMHLLCGESKLDTAEISKLRMPWLFSVSAYSFTLNVKEKSTGVSRLVLLVAFLHRLSLIHTTFYIASFFNHYTIPHTRSFQQPRLRYSKTPQKYIHTRCLLQSYLPSFLSFPLLSPLPPPMDLLLSTREVLLMLLGQQMILDHGPT
jgi:hypothetical protein